MPGGTDTCWEGDGQRRVRGLVRRAGVEVPGLGDTATALAFDLLVPPDQEAVSHAGTAGLPEPSLGSPRR